MIAARHASSPALIVAEPPAAYRVRPPVVIDASVIGALLFDEPQRDHATASMQGKRLFAPSLIDYEIASIAAKKLSKGLDRSAVELALQNYAAAAIELMNTDPLALVALTRQYELSAYDAAYLWLAGELKAPLVTFDRKLGEAAQAHLAKLE